MFEFDFKEKKVKSVSPIQSVQSKKGNTYQFVEVFLADTYETRNHDIAEDIMAIQFSGPALEQLLYAQVGEGMTINVAGRITCSFSKEGKAYPTLRAQKVGVCQAVQQPQGLPQQPYQQPQGFPQQPYQATSQPYGSGVPNYPPQGYAPNNGNLPL